MATYMFRSEGLGLRSDGANELEAWRALIGRLKSGVPAWLLTDRISIFNWSCVFLRVSTFAELNAELAEFDRDRENGEIPECDRCEGCGYVVVQNTITTDKGTKWARSATESLRETCEVCDGSGLNLSERQSFSGPG